MKTWKWDQGCNQQTQGLPSPSMVQAHFKAQICLYSTTGVHGLVWGCIEKNVSPREREGPKCTGVKFSQPDMWELIENWKWKRFWAKCSWLLLHNAISRAMDCIQILFSCQRLCIMLSGKILSMNWCLVGLHAWMLTLLVYHAMEIQLVPWCLECNIWEEPWPWISSLGVRIC